MYEGTVLATYWNQNVYSTLSLALPIACCHVVVIGDGTFGLRSLIDTCSSYTSEQENVVPLLFAFWVG